MHTNDIQRQAKLLASTSMVISLFYYTNDLFVKIVFLMRYLLNLYLI